MDIDSFVSELTDSEAEILEPRMKRETCDAITSTGYSIPQENKGYGMIYAIVKRHVDKIYETYCRSDGTHTFLTEQEIKRFLKEFLNSHKIDRDGIDILYSNMDINGDNQIDKYGMVVFFLKLACYNDLIVKVDIEEYTGFHKTL